MTNKTSRMFLKAIAAFAITVLAARASQETLRFAKENDTALSSLSIRSSG